MRSSFTWHFSLVLFPVICRSTVPAATGDMCFADDVRATILNDVLYFMGGTYSFVNGDTTSNEKFLYYLNLTTSFPVEGYIPVNSLHSIPVPSFVESTNQGAFFTSGDILYSYSTGSAFPNATDTIISYNTVTDTWSNSKVSGGAFNIAGRNGGFTTTNLDTGMGFYLGTGSPGDQNGWNLQGLLVFNGSDSNALKWANQTDNAPNIDTGSMAYIPLSKEGVLLAFGGVDTTATSDLFQNSCCYGTRDMSIINVYDIATNTWYSVTASGQIPPQRELACSVVSASPDSSSFQVTMYQGWNLLKGQAFEDVYVLTIPSFRWIKISDTGNTEQELGQITGRFGGACSIWNDRQMIVVGGGFRIGDTQVNGGTSCNTSYPAIRVLDTSTYAWQTQFQSDLGAYEVPEPMYNLIGGNASGGATATGPVGGFNNTDLNKIFALTIKSPTSTSNTHSSTPTSATNSSSPNSSNSPTHKSTPIGPIVGGIIGGIAFLAFVCGGIWCLNRHRRRPDSGTISSTNTYKKAELDGIGEYRKTVGEMGVGKDVERSELPGRENGAGQALGRGELPGQELVYELPDRRPY